MAGESRAQSTGPSECWRSTRRGKRLRRAAMSACGRHRRPIRHNLPRVRYCPRAPIDTRYLGWIEATDSTLNAEGAVQALLQQVGLAETLKRWSDIPVRLPTAVREASSRGSLLKSVRLCTHCWVIAVPRHCVASGSLN